MKRKELNIYDFVPELLNIKPNPNNWPIIHKWNTRLWHRNATRLYEWYGYCMSILFPVQLDENYGKFVDIRDINIGEEICPYTMKLEVE